MMPTDTTMGGVGNLSETIAQGAEPQSQNGTIVDAIKAERSFMTPMETAAANWMIGVLSEGGRAILGPIC
jgi:hypothetical protein